MSQDLLKQIDELVASKTFNLDALDGIKKLKDDLKVTIDNLDATTEMLKMERSRSLELQDMLRKEQEQTAQLNTKLNGMADLANKGAEAIWEKKVAEASASAYKDALYTVFKPNAVRETIQHTMPVMASTNGNSYPQTVTHQQQITREDA